MITAPLVSILLCTYNGEAYLQQQLDSLAAQTYPNLEIICSDNNSSDSTPVILQRWCILQANRKYYSVPAKGLNKNFFSALTYASGTYIMFCDQDDVWLPEKIEKLVAYHQANTDASMIYCLSQTFTGDVLPALQYKEGIKRLEGTEIKKTLLVSFTLGHNMLIRKSILDKIPIPDNEVIAYDWWITVGAMCLGPIKCVHEELTWWRQHPHNTTKEINKSLFYKSRAEYLAAFETSKLIPVPEKLWIAEAKRNFLTLADKDFSWPLFFFLVRNAAHIFFYKKNKIFIGKWISYTKWALLMSRHSYRP